MFTSFAEAASISTPPAVEVIAIAASSVPLVFTILTSSFPAVPLAATLKYASRTALPSVKSFSSATVALIPPAVAVSAIAPLSVPEVLVRENVSFAAVPCGEIIISTAPFLPSLSVCPSAKVEAIEIEPDDDSIPAA